jgi:hypothetical protein
MRRGGQVFGTILVLVGGLFLLSELGILNEIYERYNISLGSIVGGFISAAMSLWPLLLIALGVTIIFRNVWVSRTVWTVFFVAIVSFAVFAPSFFPQNGMMWFWHNNWDDHWGRNNKTTIERNDYTASVDYTSAMEKGNINIEVGAGSTTIGSNTAKAAIVDSKGGQISNDWSIDGNTLKLNVGNLESLDESHGFAGENDLKLGDKLVWDMTVQTGASDFNADLRNLKVENLDFSMGAGSAEIRLSDKLPMVDVDLEAGASSITLYVPKTAGLMIDAESGLSSVSLDDIDLKTNGDSSYKSDNYDKAASKMTIHVSAGVSSIEIIRY